ncbi:MAG TPA: hypothetical protein VKU41_04780 [Polyangiaceae bacterium]|nr:hypothetical protein [Polyangiaceae bacterium]
MSGYSPRQRERVQEHVLAARRRLVEGVRATDNVAAAQLLRVSIVHYLVAIDVASHPDARGDDDPLLDYAAQLPPVPCDPEHPAAVRSDDERVRDALATSDSLYFDRLSLEDAARTRRALERAGAMLGRRVETRSLGHLRAARWGRRAGAAVLVLYGLFAVVRYAVSPKNVALGKPVHPSSLHVNPPDGHELVDGEIGTSFGVHTRKEDNANVVIDLENDYVIATVKVHNRVDGWFDDCLPLVVETSEDGTHFDQLARREEHFDGDPPWVIEAHGRVGRYVRLRVARFGYVALSEVEIFGKKVKKK